MGFSWFWVLGGGRERKLWLLDGVGANIGLNIGRTSAKLGGSWANIRLRWGLRCANVGPTWANRAQHKANIGQVGGFMGQHNAKMGATMRQHRSDMGEVGGHMGWHGPIVLNIRPTSAKLGGLWANIRLRWGLRCANIVLPAPGCQA